MLNYIIFFFICQRFRTYFVRLTNVLYYATLTLGTFNKLGATSKLLRMEVIHMSKKDFFNLSTAFYHPFTYSVTIRNTKIKVHLTNA